MTENNLHDDWWKQAVVYQVYPRSFKDSNGDGIGDLAGIISKIDYLKQLGVDALWLSLFYPSGLYDGGYDVDDYRAVDPRLGTMADFDALVHKAHEAGLKIMVDIVPNHTSTNHRWFKEALSSPKGSPARARYIFRDGRGEHGELPPNQWRSVFGGPAWQAVGDGQWYLHTFAVQQADLNWKNPQVHQEFLTTLRFWCDHGADGFRIDVAHGLAKDIDARPLDQWPKDQMQHTENPDNTNPLWDRDEVHAIYKEWRRVFNDYTPHRFAVAEAWVVPQHQWRYASTSELGQVFNFEFAKADFRRDRFRAAIQEGLDAAHRSGSTTTWVMNNHDVPRSTTRYGLPQVNPPDHYHQIANDWILRNGASYHLDRELGTQRARAALLMEMGLPGSVYVYQGEELGLFEVPNIPWDRLEDPTAKTALHDEASKGRDGCRVPLPWSTASADMPKKAPWDPTGTFGSGASFGFSPAKKADGSPSADPHLPQPLDFKYFAVDVEEHDPDSMLTLYRDALRKRAMLLTSLHNSDDFAWLDEEDLAGAGDADHGTLIAYQRTTAMRDGGQPVLLDCITNFGSSPARLPQGDVILVSQPLIHDDADRDGNGGENDGQGDQLLLPPNASAWIAVSASQKARTHTAATCGESADTANTSDTVRNDAAATNEKGD